MLIYIQEGGRPDWPGSRDDHATSEVPPKNTSGAPPAGAPYPAAAGASPPRCCRLRLQCQLLRDMASTLYVTPAAAALR